MVPLFNSVSCPVLSQSAKVCQHKLENEVSIFEFMVKNEEHSGKRQITISNAGSVFPKNRYRHFFFL